MPTAISDHLPHRVVDIAAGHGHSMAATVEGHLYTWGRGGDGRLGHGADTSSRLVPTRVTGGALEDEGVSVVRVAAGELHSMAVTDSGQLLTWGRGEGGRLGHGNTEQRNVPTGVAGLGDAVGIAGGYEHSLVTRRSGAVMTFGSNGD